MQAEVDLYGQTFHSAGGLAKFDVSGANCRFLKIDATIIPDLTRERTNSRENAAARMAAIGRSNVPVNSTGDEAIRQWVINQLRDDNCRFLDNFGKPRNYRGDLFCRIGRFHLPT